MSNKNKNQNQSNVPKNPNAGNPNADEPNLSSLPKNSAMDKIDLDGKVDLSVQTASSGGGASADLLAEFEKKMKELSPFKNEDFKGIGPVRNIETLESGDRTSIRKSIPAFINVNPSDRIFLCGRKAAYGGENRYLFASCKMIRSDANYLKKFKEAVTGFQATKYWLPNQIKDAIGINSGTPVVLSQGIRFNKPSGKKEFGDKWFNSTGC